MDFESARFWYPDLIVEKGTDLILLEVKSTQTPSGQLLAGFERLAEILEGKEAPRIADRVAVYGGEETQERSRGRILSWRNIDALSI